MIWEDAEPLTEEPLGWNDAKPWVDLFGLPENPPPEEIPKDWKPCFIRFGGMPPNGCSYNWDAGEFERGIGVFKAYETSDDPAEYVIDFEHMVGLAGTFFRIRSRPAYLARGREFARGGAN